MRDRAELTAILGPTNTGKTHLAVERLCAHSSGMMGFPLRLLAREVYDRVVAIKGANQVALITGEEKILPKDARWLLCTAESMPLERDVAFVAIDEAQLGTDPERGHVFTDRLLHARGREETMILGSESLAPMVRALLPDAKIVGRPRFSTLSYAGPAKLSRLPPRSAIVAFSADQVYAVAEMLRRTRGGAAVVMGALSPRTRNAQVTMYQAGEVDYLVATDAIGMGLNMDVAHVAFAGLSKFDGRRRRRLTVAEMAQIAGRAGRHQRDGTFGSLTLEGEAAAAFRPEEVEAIEEHKFPPIDFLYWRDGDPDTRSLDALIRALERRPDRAGLRAAPEAVDLAVLKALASDPEVRRRAVGPDRVRRLWAAAGLPDFRKTGPDHHARLVAHLYGWLSDGDGRIPQSWYAEQLARLDNVQGDIDTLADRIAGVRTWAYIAHRPDWLADPDRMAARARGVEEKLSDALHERLTQRFVDRRTAVLMRDLAGKGEDFPVIVDAEGEVSVGSHAIGRLEGFDFHVDPAARHADRKMLLAAAERKLGGEYERRGAALAADADASFTLCTDTGAPVTLLWRGHDVARLMPGKNLLSPRVQLDRRLDRLSAAGRAAVTARLDTWLRGEIERVLGSLRRAGLASQDPAVAPAMRAVLAMLVDAGGIVPRESVKDALAGLDRAERRAIAKLRIRIGALDLFLPDMLKPEAARWRAALRAAATGAPMPELPADSAVVLHTPDDPALLERLGFRAAGPQMLRVDIAERFARHAHEARGCKGPVVDAALATSIGLKPEALARLMRAIGFRPAAGEAGWVWQGRPKPRREREQPAGHAFAKLAELKRG
ncbi:helicase-related protein [Allosphingosinicella indica]|uniref:ATP-dependent RNA helicase SUPV3L1/SUV3 n=1 Tax=Allosphingosinicella indica TaxID=941907 RepID=A0A1X7G352_9SPHN|nr:helicase-related protein [Allosphingosinicella indica]SMF63225.1 ATP-dependent RNA helicase SUPV3L1/SUV3 [Allosphingosinicella indica]